MGRRRRLGRICDKPKLQTGLDLLAWIAPAILLALVFYRLDFPVIRSDGLAYHAWLHTLAEDGNTSLAEEYSALREAGVLTGQLFEVPETGQVGTPFAFGGAILWSPLYKAILWSGQTHWYLEEIAPRIDEAAYETLQGTGFMSGLGMTLGTNLMALLCVYLSKDTMRRWVSSPLASFSGMAAFLGTPMVYYSSIEPKMAHVPATFSVTVLFWLYFRFGACSQDAQQDRPWAWLLIGAVLGLSGTIRWQLILIWLPLAAILVYQRRWSSMFTFCLGTLMLVWSVPWIWNRMFGEPLVIPASRNDPGASLVGLHSPLSVWFSPLRGLLLWSPVAGLSIVGWFLARTRQRADVLLFGAAFTLQSLAAAAVWDWWAGWSFGMRRLVELYPLYTFGLALFIDNLAARPAPRGGRTGIWAMLQWGPALLVVTAVLWSLLLLLIYAGAAIDQAWGTVADALRFWTHEGPRSWDQLLQRFTDWYGLPAWNAPPRWGRLAEETTRNFQWLPRDLVRTLRTACVASLL